MAVKVFAAGEEAGWFTYDADNREYTFLYTRYNPISLVMPPEKEVYKSRWEMLPIFDQRMPEGWLYEVLLNHLRKLFGSVEDYHVFCSLAPNIEGFLTSKTGMPI